MTSKQVHSSDAPPRKRGNWQLLLHMFASKLALGLTDQFLSLVVPVAAFLLVLYFILFFIFLFFILWVQIENWSIQVQCLPQGDSECSQGDTGPYLTLTFLVCPQMLRDFHSQILSACICVPGKWFSCASQSGQGGGEQGTTLGNNEKTLLTHEVITEWGPYHVECGPHGL